MENRKFLFLALILFMGVQIASIKTGASSIDIKTYELKNKRLDHINSINADLRYMDLIIKPSKDTYAYLSYELNCLNEKNPITYSIENDTLNLKEGKWKSILWETHKKSKIKKGIYNNTMTLYIPTETILKNNTINIKDGNMTIEDFHCNNINLNSNYGDVVITNTTVTGTMKIKTGDGNVNVKDTKASETVNINTGYGDAKIFGLNTLGKIQVKTNDGNVVFQVGKKYWKQRKVIIKTEEGDIVIDSSLSGETKEKIIENGHYERNIDYSDHSFLKVVTDCGDISLK